MKKNKILTYLVFHILLTLFINRTTLTPDSNMKWTVEYNLTDLYKKKNGPSDPDANIELSLMFSPIENVIILGAQKDIPEFDPTVTEWQAVLYISTDREQSYKELILEGNDVYDVAAYTKKYSIICTSDYKFEYIYLLNHTTFQLKAIDKYNRDGKNYYDDFDGQFPKCKKDGIRFLVNVLSKDSVKLYEIPKKFATCQYYPVHWNGDILYYSGILELRTYNVITGEDKLFNQLKHKYNYFFPENSSDYNTPLFLQNEKSENDEETYELTIYDLEGSLIRKITKENREKYYYYKDFICDCTRLHAYSELRFSFDKGKT